MGNNTVVVPFGVLDVRLLPALMLAYGSTLTPEGTKSSEVAYNE
jgi:hypothetical protein